MPASPPTISALSTPPSTSRPETFDSEADSFLSDLPGFGDDLNAVAANVYANALEAEADAATAAAAAITAASAATTALNSPATQATTSSSITIGGGSKSFTLAQTGKAFAVGQWVSVSDTANPSTRWLAGAISAFNSGTGAMTIAVAYIAGTGTGASWAVNPIGPITSTDAGNLTGTLPDAVFPTVLPAVSGANLTALNASNFGSGTVPDARFPATLPSGVTVPAAQLSGNVSQARIAAALNASGSAPLFAARAWVNFNGTGTLAILASGNVSSVTDNGTGDYTINFTTAMPSADYAVAGSASGGVAPDGVVLTVRATGSGVAPITKTTSALRIRTSDSDSSEDSTCISVAIFN